MTNGETIAGTLLAIVIFLAIGLQSIGYCVDRVYKPSPYELWNVVSDIQNSRQVYDLMVENGWVYSTVSFEEFDYISVLAQQLSQQFPNVEPYVALALISVESSFRVDAYNHGTIGLTQINPRWQQDRFDKYADESLGEDWYTPRVNIAVGLDYLNYILGEVDGDLNYALMWYNQGAVSACDDYVYSGKVSSYAKTVSARANAIWAVLSKGGDWYVPSAD